MAPELAKTLIGEKILLCRYIRGEKGSEGVMKMKWKLQRGIRPGGLCTILTKGQYIFLRSDKAKKKFWASKGRRFWKGKIWANEWQIRVILIRSSEGFYFSKYYESEICISLKNNCKVLFIMTKNPEAG